MQVINGVILVTSAAIGIGIMALPVATSAWGFFPALTYFFLCWIFSMCTGLLLYETCLWMPPGSSFMTITKKLLGPLGGHLFWCFYFVFFLLGMVAHVLEGRQTISLILNGHIPEWVCAVGYTALFFPLIFFGLKWVEKFNGILILCALATFIAFVSVSYHKIDFEFISRMTWKRSWYALPIIMFAFTYQLVIPTLSGMVKHNVKRMRLIIFIGTAIPFLAYAIWDFVMLGLKTDLAVFQALQLEGGSSIHSLEGSPNLTRVLLFGAAFALFMPSAAFATYALSFRDFLADGMYISRGKWRKALLCFFILAIPVLLALLYPHFFLVALRYAGGIDVAVIFGLMPPLMVWIGRYRQNRLAEHPLPVGKITLSAIILFALVNICIQLLIPT